MSLKLFVKARGDASVKILRFILDNIDLINDMKVNITIVKVDTADKQVTRRLAHAGVTSLPALQSESKNTYLGCRKIIDLFEVNFEKYLAKTENKPPATSEPPTFNNNFGADPQLGAFYADAMKPSKDEAEENDRDGMASEHFSRRMEEQNKKRKLTAAKTPDQPTQNTQQSTPEPPPDNIQPRRGMPMTEEDMDMMAMDRYAQGI
jgi:hypothetical protein